LKTHYNIETILIKRMKGCVSMNRKHRNQMCKDYSTFYKNELNKNHFNKHEEPLTTHYKVNGFDTESEDHSKSESKWC